MQIQPCLPLRCPPTDQMSDYPWVHPVLLLLWSSDKECNRANSEPGALKITKGVANPTRKKDCSSNLFMGIEGMTYYWVYHMNQQDFSSPSIRCELCDEFLRGTMPRSGGPNSSQILVKDWWRILISNDPVQRYPSCNYTIVTSIMIREIMLVQ